MLHHLQKLDFLLAIIVIIFGGYSFYTCLSFDDLSRSYPLFISGVMVCIGIWIFIASIMTNDSSVPMIFPFFEKVRKPFMLAGIYLLWVISLQFGIGYLLASGLATFVVLIFIDGYKLVTLLAFSFVLSVLIYVLFGVVFDIPLPEAQWLSKILTMLGKG